MRHVRRLALWALPLLMAGCYATEQIALADLSRLAAAPGRAAETQVTGVGCGGCQVTVHAATPLVLTDAQGRPHRMTPFYFHLSPTQLVAPDYGVLLQRDELTQVAVRTLSTARTLMLVTGVAAVALGGFFAIQATAGEARLTR